MWAWLLAIITALATAWRPMWGMMVLVLAWPSYLLRTSIVGVPTTALELSIYAAAAAILIRLLTKSTTWHWVAMTKTTWWLLALWVIAWITATAMAADTAAALGALKAWMLDPLLFVAILAVVVRTVEDRQQIVNAALLSGVLVALAGLVQLLFFRSTLQEGRLSSWFAPVANYAAMYLAPLFVLGAGLLLHDRRTTWRWAAVIIIGLATILTLSFGAYLAVAVGLIYIWWYLPAGVSKRRLARIGAVVVVIGILGLTQTRNFQQHFDFTGRSSGSVRQQIWVTSWALIKQRPWFGVGPNNFETAYRAELPKHYFPPLEWLVAQPHNLYLALWLETGLLGLLTFLALLGRHTKLVWQKFLPDERHRAMAIASSAAMIAVIVHGFIDTPYFKNDLALEFLFLAVLPWLGRGTVQKNSVS